MTMNPLPPQAYTKDTLLKAYAWLQSQNESIKEMATTTDILVSLYLKASRDGDSALDRPSIQNFKNELRSLAGMMGELSTGTQSQTVINPTVVNPTIIQSPQPQNNFTTGQVQGTHVNTIQSAQTVTQVLTTTNESKTIQTRTLSLSEGLAQLNIDQHTLQMIDEIKNELNLGSDLDALKVLVKIGHSKLTAMLKS